MAKPTTAPRPKIAWRLDAMIVASSFVPSLLLFGIVYLFSKLSTAGLFFSTGLVDRATIVPWSIGIGQIAFALVAGVLAITIPRHTAAQEVYKRLRPSLNDEQRIKMVRHYGSFYALSGALIGLSLFAGLSAMSLDPFWWVLIENRFVLHRYPLREDYYYPELPLWILGSIYLISMCILLYLTVRNSSDFATEESVTTEQAEPLPVGTANILGQESVATVGGVR